MKIDVTLLPTGPADVRPAAEAAEAAGYSGVWAAEVSHDPLLSLALAATATERVDLGTHIALAFARNPMSLAVAAHDLQAVSGGRFSLGLGTQVKAHITRRFSMPWSRPASRMREYVLALRAIWNCWEDDTVLDFRGEFYQHTLMAPMFVPPSHGYRSPRVLLAGVGKAMTEVAGEVADGLLCHAFTTERYVREVTVPVLERTRPNGLEGFALIGAPLIATGATQEDFEFAVARIRKQIAFYASTPSYRGVMELHGWEELADELHALSRDARWDDMGHLVDDAVLNAFAIVGEPESVADEVLRRYGSLFERCTLYTPYPADPATIASIATRIINHPAHSVNPRTESE